MLRGVFAVCVLATLTLAGRAPNADVVEHFKKTPLGSRFSNDVYADALLDVPDLIAKYGYPVETHSVQTSDDYEVTMHRIPAGRERHTQPGPRPVVFLMHGLLSSSADYVVLGPGNALAYLLAEEGYDVWLGNARGNYYSRKHRTMNPNSNANFWTFSWEDIGRFDLPAFVDYILAVTGQSQLHYVGHSQGGTAFLVLNSLLPEYNVKFKSFQGLAPAAYFENNESVLFNTLARYEKIIEAAALTFGFGEILSNAQAQRLVSSFLCDGAELFDPVCVGAITGASGALSNFNSTMIPLFLSHAPAGSSIRQVAHFAQVIRRGVFARFYYNPVTNLLLYGRINPPEFDMSRVTVPAFLYYGLADAEVDYRDLLLLASRLSNTVETYRPPRDKFNHFDFIWGNNVRAEIYERLMENIKKLD